MNDLTRKLANNPVENNRCASKPFGCGMPITQFRDALSKKEYQISGLCQSCQDAFFDDDERFSDELNEHEMNELSRDREFDD